MATRSVLVSSFDEADDVQVDFSKLLNEALKIIFFIRKRRRKMQTTMIYLVAIVPPISLEEIAQL